MSASARLPAALAVLTIPAVLAAAGPAAPPPKGPLGNVYLPTAKGTVRVYQWTTTDEKEQPVRTEVTEVVTAVEKTAAGLLVTVTHRMEGSKYAGTDTFRVSEAGLFTTRTSMTGPDVKGELSWTIDPPAFLLKLPHAAGATWEYSCPAQPGGLVGVRATNTARGPEDVVVPAGTYRAVRVEQRGRANDRDTAATYWYAPGVGLVKMEGEGVVQELKSVTPGP